MFYDFVINIISYINITEVSRGDFGIKV